MSHELHSELGIKHETRQIDGQEVTVVRLEGRLNDATYERCAAALIRLIAEGHRHLRIDLEKATLGGCGAGAIMTAFHAADERGGSVVLIQVNEFNLIRLNLFGVLRLIPVEPLPETAVTSAHLLQKTDVSLEKAHQKIEVEVGPGDKTDVINTGDSDSRLMPAVEHLYTLAAEESRRMNLDYVGPEHMLLALLREEGGLAAKLLHQQGLNLETVRAQVAEQLQSRGDN